MVRDITPIQQAIKKIIETLQQIHQNIIPSNHIGVKLPMSKNDLPTVVISAKNIKELSPGIGNLIGIVRVDAEHISEIKGSKVSGLFQLNIFAISAEKVEEITTAIIGIISEKKVELEKGCFLYFSLESIGDIAPSKITSGLRRDVWSRLLEYHGMYELIDKETYGPEGFIKEIHAHIDDVFDEKMIIKEVDR